LGLTLLDSLDIVFDVGSASILEVLDGAFMHLDHALVGFHRFGETRGENSTAFFN
jgi:hypothetical protein